MARRGFFRIDPDSIVRLLDLPQRMYVTGVHPAFDPVGIIVTVEGPQLEHVDDNAQSPYLGGSLAREAFTGPDGKLYGRLAWSLPEPQPAEPTSHENGSSDYADIAVQAPTETAACGVAADRAVLEALVEGIASDIRLLMALTGESRGEKRATQAVADRISHRLGSLVAAGMSLAHNADYFRRLVDAHTERPDLTVQNAPNRT